MLSCTRSNLLHSSHEIRKPIYLVFFMSNILAKKTKKYIDKRFSGADNENMIANDNKAVVAKALKQYRLEREWTLEQTAVVTGLSPSTIQKIENGTHFPHDLTLHILCKRLPGLLDGRQNAGSDSAN